MKRLTLIISILLAASFFMGCANQKNIRKEYVRPQLREYGPPVRGPKFRVAIGTFKNSTELQEKLKLGENFGNLMATELWKSGRFTLLERENLEQLEAENSAGVPVADYLITGAITDYSEANEGSKFIVTDSKRQYANVTVDVRVINTKTGEIILAGSGEGNADLKRRKALGLGTSGGYDPEVASLALQAAAVNVVEDIIYALEGQR